MKCPYCGYQESKVVDSRHSEDNTSIRRRRECLSCQKRFTTYETVESLPMIVVKKDNSRQSFDRNKILNGMVRACEKRPVSIDQLKQMIADVEKELKNQYTEVPVSEIGECIMRKLLQMDEVAYVRFASVYKEFSDVQTFIREIEVMKERK